MNNTIKKVMSYVLLPAFLAANYSRASESSEKINIDNSKEEFEFPQSPLRIGSKDLKEGITYLIDKNSRIVKPDQGIEAVMGYVENNRPYFKAPEGNKMIEDKLRRLRYLKITTRDVDNLGLEKFINAASDGVITPDEYSTLSPGDVYVTETVYGEMGAIDRGVIVKVGSYTGQDSKITEEDIVEREDFSEKPKSEPKKIEAVIIDKKEFSLTPVTKNDKNWCKRHPVLCGLTIGTLAAGAAVALSNGSGNGNGNGDNDGDPDGSIGGGNGF